MSCVWESAKIEKGEDLCMGFRSDFCKKIKMCIDEKKLAYLMFLALNLSRRNHIKNWINILYHQCSLSIEMLESFWLMN